MMKDVDIVLLGHGSHRGTATDNGLRDAVARLQERVASPVRVRMAAFEFTRPSLREAVGSLVRAGGRRIVIVPYFLFDGKHISLEIPEDLETLAREFPGVELRYARTLGTDPRLIDVLVDRLHVALNGSPCDAAACACWKTDMVYRCRYPYGTPCAPGACSCWADHQALGVMLVNRGSHPEFDQGTRLRQLASLLGERLGGRVPVAPAHAEYAAPTMLDAAEQLVAAGRETVLVAPYIFFPGKVLYDNILPAVETAKAHYPTVDFRVAPTLGVDDRLIAIALERSQEALLTNDAGTSGDVSVFHL